MAFGLQIKVLLCYKAFLFVGVHCMCIFVAFNLASCLTFYENFGIIAIKIDCTEGEMYQ